MTRCSVCYLILGKVVQAQLLLWPFRVAYVVIVHELTLLVLSNCASLSSMRLLWTILVQYQKWLTAQI